MKLYELVYEQQKYIYLCSKNVRLLLDAIDTEQNLDRSMTGCLSFSTESSLVYLGETNTLTYFCNIVIVTIL